MRGPGAQRVDEHEVEERRTSALLIVSSLGVALLALMVVVAVSV